MITGTLEILERYKQVMGVSSDSAASRLLGIKRQAVSNWRRRGTQAEPRSIQAMCDALREDAAPWLIRVQYEQAHHVDDKQAWRRLALHLGYNFANALAALLMLGNDATICLVGIA